MLAWDTPTPNIRHLLDFFTAGTSDAVWVPKIASEGWVVLTADRGKSSSKNKLPGICEQFKVTHILMGSSILHLKQNQKAHAIISVWEEIKKCNEAPKGSRFIMSAVKNQRVSLRRVV
jgi:hypothetical protein